MVVHTVGVVGKLAHLPARLHPGCTTGRHPAKARRGKAQHAADDAQHVVGGVHNVVRARHQDAAALSSRHHNVTQSSRRNSAQPNEAAQRPQPKDHGERDAHHQQGHTGVGALFAVGTQKLHRGLFVFQAKDMLCCMDCSLSYAPCPVTDLHAPALKAVGEGVRHGIAEGTHLVFQLLLDLPALCFPHFIVFTIVHQIFLTLLPDDTGR